MLDKVPDLPPDPVLGLQPHLLRASELPLTAPILALGNLSDHFVAAPTQLATWLMAAGHEDDARGIMTLRGMSGVILALFCFSVGGEAAMLLIPCLRVIEFTGRHRTLGATFRTMSACCRAFGCHGVLLPTEAVRAAGPEVDEGLRRIGRAHGFRRVGEGWAYHIAPW